MSNDLAPPDDRLFQDIGQLIDAARQRAAVAVNVKTATASKTIRIDCIIARLPVAVGVRPITHLWSGVGTLS